MSLLSIETNATTIDGSYPTGRKLPVLVRSGIETLDGAKYGQRGLETLEHVLKNASSYNLKWVLCNDRFYENTLTEMN